MGTVVGPIAQDDWNTMRMLRGSIEWMKGERTRDPERFDDAVDREKKIYSNFMSKYVN
jgi:hypothetical protein